MDWEIQLISLYVYICNQYQHHLWVYCQRFSTHAELSFTDEEVLCIYLFGVMEKRREIKEIYTYADRHLRPWFPRLPSYGGFVQRLNRLADVFAPLLESLQTDCPQTGVLHEIRLMDSMPICIAHAKRSSTARVAAEIANKGYCSSKKMYYYGVKVHLLALRRAAQIPLPDYIGLSSASENDLSAFRQIAHQLYGGEIYLDKAYADQALKKDAESNQDLTILTPVKKAKDPDVLETADQWLSTAVSQVRQPIESLFNWIEQKTGIQSACKVRSYNGLLVHVFGRLAAAMWLLTESA